MKRTHSLLLACSLLVAAAAAADDMQNFPASLCVASSGTLLVRSDGQAENGTAAAVTVVCPVPRPNLGGVVTTHFSGTVWVVDRHPTENVCCRAYSKNPTGALIPGAQVCSTGDSSSYQTLALPQLDDGFTWSHFFVQCTLPATSSGLRSRLLTYRANQL